MEVPPSRSTTGPSRPGQGLRCATLPIMHTTVRTCLALASLLALTLSLSSCGNDEELAEPGVRGPVVFRLWDAQARADGLPPTVVRADAVRQANLGFDDLEMVPVLVRRPVSDGVLWIHSPKGRFQAAGRAQELSLTGPVYVSGVLRGVPVGGSAARADVPRGQRVLVLQDLQLVRGGMLITAPSAELTDGKLSTPGPMRVAPGAPAMAAVLGSVPR